ncbi:hypothetical protein RRG08_032868 [Elysia crispata]|uniref:Uncharacterized protein n=1 Tax=Elysia crispata TaxID=231223 RepID=A0AAE0ZK52_9GAST|nr:hypothetical protein RRG08_032868 [Elysia crispata]
MDKMRGGRHYQKAAVRTSARSAMNSSDKRSQESATIQNWSFPASSIYNGLLGWSSKCNPRTCIRSRDADHQSQSHP